MSTPKFEVEKFNGESDFTLWSIKRKALMAHQVTSAVLDLTDQASIEDKKILADIISKAYIALILRLRDEVLREVSEESNALDRWMKTRKSGNIWVNKTKLSLTYTLLV